MGWLAAESSVFRFVTGVVLLGGIGGDGLTGWRLAPPEPCENSPINAKTKQITKLFLMRQNSSSWGVALHFSVCLCVT